MGPRGGERIRRHGESEGRVRDGGEEGGGDETEKEHRRWMKRSQSI